MEVTAPYAHWQPGRIKRQWGTLVPMAHSIIRQAALPKSYWAMAMADAVRIRNRVHGSVPYELATCRRVDLSSMRVFGCSAYVHDDKYQRRKLDDRAWKGVFAGYVNESPGWLVYNLATRMVVSSSNVVFDEGCVLSHVSSPWGRVAVYSRYNAMMMTRTTPPIRATCVEKSRTHLWGSRRY
jgi:hypothetical protein